MFRSLTFKIALIPAMMIGGFLATDTKTAEAAGPVRMMHRMHMARRVMPVAPIVRTRVVAPVVSYRAPVVVRPTIRPIVPVVQPIVPMVRPVVPVRYTTPVIHPVVTPIVYPSTTVYYSSF